MEAGNVIGDVLVIGKLRTSPNCETIFASEPFVDHLHKYSHPNDYSPFAQSAKLPQGLVREVVLGEDGLSEDHLEGRPDASGHYFFLSATSAGPSGWRIAIGWTRRVLWLAVWRCG